MDPIAQVIKVAGSDALNEMNRPRRETKASKLHPFLVGTVEELDDLREGINPPEDGGIEIITQAQAFDVAAWLAENAPKKKVSWPKTPSSQNNTFVSLIDLTTGKLKPEVNIILVEANRSRDVFARLGYGIGMTAPHRTSTSRCIVTGP
jgi:hypothetical protein